MSAGKRRRFRKRYVLYAVLLLAVGYQAWPILDPHWEQDSCTFGTGSTALYEAMEEEAEHFLQKDGWAEFPSFSIESQREFMRKLDNQIDQFVMTRRSATERTAAYHALFRTYGMYYADIVPRLKELSQEPIKPLWLHFAAVKYHAVLPRLNPFCFQCYIFPIAGWRTEFEPLEPQGNFKLEEYNETKSYLNTVMPFMISSPAYKPISGDRCPEILPQLNSR